MMEHSYKGKTLVGSVHATLTQEREKLLIDLCETWGMTKAQIVRYALTNFALHTQDIVGKPEEVLGERESTDQQPR